MLPHATKSRRLCTTCRNAAGCMYAKDPRHAVTFCEEFEAGEVRLATVPGPAGVAEPAPAAPAAGEAGEPKGLCSDCDARATCVFPRPPGGVWHCEEYSVGPQVKTVRPDALVDPDWIRRIVERHRRPRGAVIAILEEIQAAYGYLPKAALEIVSRLTGRSLVDLYGVATFYRSFSLQARGRQLVCACLGTACHVRGAPAVVEELERRLGIRTGETTTDGEFTLETVNCLGACALGPIVVLEGEYFPNVNPAGAGRILEATRSRRKGTGG